MTLKMKTRVLTAIAATCLLVLAVSVSYSMIIGNNSKFSFTMMIIIPAVLLLLAGAFIYLNLIQRSFFNRLAALEKNVDSLESDLRNSTAKLKEKEEQLENIKENEEKLRNIYDQSPIGILLYDSKAILLQANKSCLDIFGLSGMREFKRVQKLITSYLSQKIANKLANKDVAYIDYALDFDELRNKGFIFLKKHGVVFLHITVSRLVPSNSDSGYLVQVQDVTEQKKSEQEIRFLSFHDKLTGLYNRAFFEEELRRLNTERHLPLSLVVGDINGLKIANDVFGHHEGDKLLLNTVDIIKKSCRKCDVIARWGGDEFVIILPKTSEKTAEKVCRRIVSACSEVSADRIKPSISLGVATKNIASYDIDKIFRIAENRMYHNKLFDNSGNRNSIITTLIDLLYEKGYETKEHVERISKMVQKFGSLIGLAENDKNDLILLARLHDVGKVGIPESLIFSKEQLCDEDLEIMKKHTDIGYRIAVYSREYSHIAEAILTHHERWDGTGYLQGLKGAEINLLSRILAILEAYDSMTNKSLYREAITEEEALEELVRCSGTQFDPELVEKFMIMMDRVSSFAMAMH